MMNYRNYKLIKKKNKIIVENDDINKILNKIEKQDKNLILEKDYMSKIARSAYIYNRLSSISKKYRFHLKNSCFLFGVCDFFGILEKNQIYVQIHKEKGNKKIIKGEVLITKNPCISTYDIQKVEAIDNDIINEYFSEFYENVVIFPSKGEIPLPSKISHNNTDIFDLKLWFVLNNEKNENQQNIYKIINEDYFLHENDIIKFGNVKYIVFELHIDSKEINNNEEEYETENNENNNYDINELNKNAGPILDFYPSPKESYNSPNEKNNIICHICKKFECSEENPIIKFCNCNSFHFFCLKTEIKEKIIKKTNHKNVKSYYINGINCKNCNFIYPLKFKISEKIYDLIDIKKPSGNFLILLSIETKIYYGYMKLIHVVELNEQEITITIGRESTNDVINPDPSISRQHAIIKYNQKNGKVLLKNLSKKYGTLVLIKKSLKLNENKIQLQIGKIFFEAQIMKFGEFERLKNKNTKNPLPKKD